MKYLYEHNNRYYFRRRISKTKKNITVSLQTNNLMEAKYILNIIDIRLNLLLEKGFSMDFDEELEYITEIIKIYVNEAKQEYKKFSKERELRYSYTSKKGKERLGSHPKAIEKAIKNLSDILHSPNRDKIYNEIIETTNIRNKCDYALTILSEENQDRLKDEVIKAEIELLYNDKINNEARINNPSKYIFNENTPIINKNIVKYENESYYSKKAIDIFLDFMKKKKKEVEEPFRYERDIKIFLSLTNKEYLIDITHDNMKDFLEDFMYLPNQNKNQELYKKNGEDFKEIIAISKKEELIRLDNTTIRNKLININAFLDYAIEYEYLDKNKLRYKISLSEENPSDKRKEYYNEQLHALFYKSSWYTKELENNLKDSPSKIWLPLILLFSGCRLNEIAQIRLSQIDIKDSINFFRIEAKYKDQKLKNKTSKRKIPIHQTLIDLGILDFIDSQRKNNKERLFEELYYTNNKGYGQAFSKRFNDKDFKKEWLSKSDIAKIEEEDILLDLHSFRHNFSGSLKGLIEDGLLEYFMGHSQNSESLKRYGKYRSALMFDNISKCEYEIKFDNLKEKINNYYKSIEK